ncbi:MAG: tripartite tricarboxylate transporter substrate binding protein [Betaproteobacteria bacterium]|nr:tripartite tricarboxylate transporter substrate binding protein [Betaproteobacteria bacterium]
MMHEKIFAVCTLVLPPLLSSVISYAQDYPTKPVRVIVASSPGGGTDTTARVVSPKLTELLGQQVVVENRPGAASMLGSEFVARAPADGYTLLVAPSPLVIVPALYRKMRFDPIKDFAPISKLISVPQMLVSHPSLPAKTLQDLMALAKAKPGQLDYGAGVYGGHGHMSMALFLMMTGLTINHIPYKSGNAGIAETLSGEVPIMMGNVLVLLPHVRSSRLRAYGVSSAKRASALADIPSIAEAGVPGYDSSQWFGLLAPVGTPREVVARLHRDTGRVLNDGEVKKRFALDGGETAWSASPEAFHDFLRADLAKWAKVVKAAGLKQQ